MMCMQGHRLHAIYIYKQHNVLLMIDTIVPLMMPQLYQSCDDSNRRSRSLLQGLHIIYIHSLLRLNRVINAQDDPIQDKWMIKMGRVLIGMPGPAPSVCLSVE